MCLVFDNLRRWRHSADTEHDARARGDRLRSRPEARSAHPAGCGLATRHTEQGAHYGGYRGELPDATVELG
jgi:hypothetical protein